MTFFFAGALVGVLLTFLFVLWVESLQPHKETPAEKAARMVSINRAMRLDPGHSTMCDCTLCLRAFGG